MKEKRDNTKSRKGWVMGNRAAGRKQEFERIGVVFYKTVKEALEGITKDKFEEVWKEYYVTLDHKGVSNGGRVTRNAWERKKKQAVDSDSEEDKGGEVDLCGHANDSGDDSD